MNPTNPARRVLAATLLLAFAGIPLGASAQAKAKVEAAGPAGCSAKLKGSAAMKVKLTTSMGAITIELNKEKAPVSAENFVKYVESGHYNGTIFHRVIDGFMVQGGGFEPGMTQKPTRDAIENEASNGLKNEAYTIAMARTPHPNSATAQFFINVANNSFLNFTAPTPQGYGYAVFGKVVEGMDVVDAIKKVKTGNRAGHQDVPLEDVIITKAEIV